MQALRVGEEFDVVEQGAQRLDPCFWNAIAEVVEALGFDRRPKRLGQSVVVVRPMGTPPLRLMLWSICSCSSNKQKPSLAYCEPRSKWWMTMLGNHRILLAPWPFCFALMRVESARRDAQRQTRFVHRD